ncbi:hypothetical protein [Halopiger aswanensis]|uniref:Uncharacterized protein n=1 Tax=Halopiger aswanensis TaxID=148449 RepID=A0A3R7EHV6_9EURY|nr:hypothetical protein [Halopiger aswanensis]RKD98146.1 hypothetical protein ATJ93_1150 [Halopiger aswanensis]
MSKRDGTDTDRERGADSAASAADTETESGSSSMLARCWTIAHRYREPAAYGIPELPAWHVRSSVSGSLEFAVSADSEPFLRAERPVRVRR